MVTEARNLDPINAGHIHEIGPIEADSGDPDVEFHVGTYPTTVIYANGTQYHLNHFSRFETGVESEPDLFTKYSLKGDEVVEEVLFGFERVRSTDRRYLEFRLTSGLVEGGVGNAGILKAKDINSISRFMAFLLTGNNQFADSLRSVRADKNALNFFIQQELFNNSSGLGSQLD